MIQDYLLCAVTTIHQPRQQVNTHRFCFQVYIQEDLFERWEQDFALVSVFNHVNVIRAGFDDLGDKAQVCSRLINHVQANDLVLVILTFREQWTVLSRDINGLGAIFRRPFGRGNSFETEDQAIVV